MIRVAAMRYGIVYALAWFPSAAFAPAKVTQSAIHQAEARVKAEPRNATAVRELHMLLASPNDLTREESMRLREVVRKHSTVAIDTLVPLGEPGEPVVISGTVRDEQGRPVQGALVAVFQTDAGGLYAKSDATRRRMDEPNSRIFGHLRTGADGTYEFRTVRPGGYPLPLPKRPGDQAWIPAHIHFLVTAPGYQNFGCGRESCQIVFSDDPRMTPHWQEWARKLTFPVLNLSPVADGFRRATFDVSMQKEKKR